MSKITSTIFLRVWENRAFARSSSHCTCFFQVTTEWVWPKSQNARSPIQKWYVLSSVWVANSVVLLLRPVLTVKSCSTCVKNAEWVHIHTNVIWLFTSLKEHHFYASKVRLYANFKSSSQYYTLKTYFFSVYNNSFGRVHWQT